MNNKVTASIALVTVALAATSTASAEDIDFTGTAGTSCAFSAVVPGTLNVVGSSFTTDSAATYTITNNDPGVYQVLVPQVTAFNSAPGSAALSGDLSQSIIVSTGANQAGSFTGSNATGWSQPLTDNGTDNLAHTVSGTITDAEEGSYVVRVPVTCVAI